jgi:hypothetical protein
MWLRWVRALLEVVLKWLKRVESDWAVSEVSEKGSKWLRLARGGYSHLKAGLKCLRYAR